MPGHISHAPSAVAFVLIALLIPNAFSFLLSSVGGHDLLWSLRELWTCLTLLVVVLSLVDSSYLRARDLPHFGSPDAPRGCGSETRPSVQGC